MVSQGLTDAEIAQVLGVDAATVGADVDAVNHKIADLLRDFGAIAGHDRKSTLLEVDEDSSQSGSWDPKVRLILIDHGDVAITLERPSTSDG
jgi:hypothetical protein